MNLKLCASLVKMLQEPGTMWLLLFCDLCHSSLRMLGFLLSLVIQVFEVHELGISLDHHLRTGFVVSLHSLAHSGGRNFERKKQTFSIGFSQIFLICWTSIRSVLMHVRSWVFTITLPNFIAILGWVRQRRCHVRNKIRGAGPLSWGYFNHLRS